MSFAVFGAAVAPVDGHALRSAWMRRLALVLIAVGVALALAFTSAAPPVQASGGEGRSEANQIVAIARDQLGKPWVRSATGMKSFDCSGLVYRVYQMNGLLDRIGGGRKTARGYYDWFRKRGLASKGNPKVGDLIIYGNSTHIGIYIGDGQAISTLTSGVKRHGAKSLTTRFTAYLHVNLDR